jgi:hypothetical protein
VSYVVRLALAYKMWEKFAPLLEHGFKDRFEVGEDRRRQKI